MFNSGLIKETEKKAGTAGQCPPPLQPLLFIEVQQSQPCEDYGEGTV